MTASAVMMFHSKTVTTLPPTIVAEAVSDFSGAKPLKRKAFLAPEGALLDNKTLGGTGSCKSQSWRYRALPMAGRVLTPTDGTKGPSVCYCSRYPAKRGRFASAEVAEIHRTDTRRLKVVGLQKCGSAWLCPVCAVSHARRQWMKTERALKVARAKGCIAVMVTNTVGRQPDEALAGVKADLVSGLSAARQTREWKAAKKVGLCLGAMPFIEVLHNVQTGWHPHGHSLMFFKGSRPDIEAVIAAYMTAFKACLRRKGRAVDDAAQDVTFIETDEDLGRYITKGAAAWEVSGGVKAARSRSSRSIWDLYFLADAGDRVAAHLAREYAAVMPGTRSGVLSPELARNLGVDDDDDGDSEPDSDVVGKVHVDVMVRVANHGHLADLSDAVEGFEGWSTLEGRIFKWARCTEDERDCYRALLADALSREAARSAADRNNSAACAADRANAHHAACAA